MGNDILVKFQTSPTLSQNNFAYQASITQAFAKKFEQHNITLTLDKLAPKGSTISSTAVPQTIKLSLKKGNKNVFTYVFEEGAPNASVTLLPTFEHLNYQFGKVAASNKLSISDKNVLFMLHGIESEILGDMLVACDELDEHSLSPIGYVQNGSGASFLISYIQGAQLQSSSHKTRTDYEKSTFPSAIMERLAKLHKEGFICGGLAPDDVVILDGTAKLKDASRIVANPVHSEDSVFYEAASTLHQLKKYGLVSTKDLRALAKQYLSILPLKSKKLNGDAVQELVATAKRFDIYFPSV